MSSKFIKLEINPSSINLDSINKSCTISSSVLKKEVDINDGLPVPDNWSRNNLIKQFNLLSIYPWFWKQSLKDDLNKGFDIKPLVKVKPNGYEYPVDITQLKNYKDTSDKKYILRYTNDLSGVIRHASDQNEHIYTVPDQFEDIDPSLPDFKRDENENIILDCNVQFYSCYLNSSKQEMNKSFDISGFYYTLDNINNYTIDKDAMFIFESKVAHSIGINTYNMDKYINDKKLSNQSSIYYHNVLNWPPQVGDYVMSVDKTEGTTLQGVVQEIKSSDRTGVPTGTKEYKVKYFKDSDGLFELLNSADSYITTFERRKNIMINSELSLSLPPEVTIADLKVTLKVGDIVEVKNKGKDNGDNTWKVVKISKLVRGTGNSAEYNVKLMKNYPFDQNDDPDPLGTDWGSANPDDQSRIIKPKYLRYNTYTGFDLRKITNDNGTLGLSGNSGKAITSKKVGTQFKVDLNYDIMDTTSRGVSFKYTIEVNRGIFIPGDIIDKGGKKIKVINFDIVNGTPIIDIVLMGEQPTFTANDILIGDKSKAQAKYIKSSAPIINNNFYYKIEFSNIQNTFNLNDIITKGDYKLKVIKTPLNGNNTIEVELTQVGSTPIEFTQGEQLKNQINPPNQAIGTLKSVAQGFEQPTLYKKKKGYYSLYTHLPENIKEYRSIINEINGKTINKEWSDIYDNDLILKPTLCDMECEMLYSDLNREDKDIKLKNTTPYGYLRLIFKAKPVDVPMYMDNKYTIPCLTIEQKGTNTSEVYGYIPALRYVYSSHNKFIHNSLPVYHGEAHVIKTLNVLFKHTLDLQRPYDFLFGIYIKGDIDKNGNLGATIQNEGSTTTDEATKEKAIGSYIAKYDGNSNQQYTNLSNNAVNLITLKGITDDKTLGEDGLKVILKRAKNFVNYVSKPKTQRTLESGKDKKNLYEYFDLISRGDVTKEDQFISYYEIPNFNSVSKKIESTTQRVINLHIKLGQILVLGSGTHALNTKLINNGILIIKPGGILDISENKSAYIINNGIIICLGSGKIVVTVSGIKKDSETDWPHTKIFHYSNIERVIHNSIDERTFNNHLHSCLIPGRLRKMSAKLKLTYEKETTDIYSKINSLFISTNASKITVPKWNDTTKKLDFELVAPSQTASGVNANTAPPYYTFFIPDYLILKWWNISRKEVEDNLGTANGIVIYRIDNNTGQKILVPIITDKIVNHSMGGLLVKMDIHKIKW